MYVSLSVVVVVAFVVVAFVVGTYCLLTTPLPMSCYSRYRVMSVLSRVVAADLDLTDNHRPPFISPRPRTISIPPVIRRCLGMPLALPLATCAG